MFLSLWRRAVRQLTPSSPQRPRKQARLRLQVEPLEDRVLPATFLVGNTDDAGAGSLRQAILDANANPGADLIAFDIGGGGVQTIRPASPLPALTGAVTIDGATQPGFDGSPLIELNGSLFNGGPNGFGLLLTGGDSTVRGLVINGFSGADIRIAGGGNNRIVGNYLGTDVTGSRAVTGSPSVSNLGLFILSSGNTIGGTTPEDRNLISGNNGSGVLISGTFTSGNVVQGNYIGTDVTGTQALPNGRHGVEVNGPNNLVGGTALGAGNLISGNGLDGVAVGTGGADRDNRVEGNYIGTDVTGTQAVGNGTGVEVAGTINTTIGGTATGAGNLISGNRNAGLITRSDPIGLQIQGNNIGTDAIGTRALGNQVGISIGGTMFGGVTVGGTAPGAGNVISGNAQRGIFIQTARAVVVGNYIGTDASGTAALGNRTGVTIGFGGTDNVIGGAEAGAGNVISGNTLYGVEIANVAATRNRIEGNFIGTDAAGSVALGNGFGVFVFGSADNTIGGTAPGARNVISGNLTGVVVTAANGNVIQGNYIGTDVTGTRAVANQDGIDLLSGVTTVGGAAAGAGNVISGNTEIGLGLFASGSLVQGNLIGTDAGGTVALPNGTGISVSGANNTIGGTSEAARNVISGNGSIFLGTPGGAGVQLFGEGAIGNRVQGNFIGTDVTGTSALPNRGGVSLEVGASDNTIGGIEAGAGNVLSGNSLGGVLIRGASNNLVQGNRIGTDAAGTAALSNPVGILLQQGSGNTIGGTEAGAGNVISGNTNEGIQVLTTGNRIEGNSIGTDASGTAALGNSTGVLFGAGGANATLGGTASGAGNVVSGNGLGVFVRTDGVVLQGNRIGTNAAGTAAVANNRGVFVEFARADTTIGGPEPGAGNLISGNQMEGIVDAGIRTVIQGNFIGTDASGTTALGNQTGVSASASNNTIGGVVEGAGNLISGNLSAGILLSGNGYLIQGNVIGTNAAGSQALGNGVGVRVSGASNLIGGTEPGARNVISGNRFGGIDITGGSNQVQGNYIGTDVTGTRPVRNNINAGVWVRFGASNNTIGGTAPGAGNLISGNTNSIAGVLVEGNNNRVQGNLIGTDAAGTRALGNDTGVEVGGPNNLIGGAEPGARNVISSNGRDGVFLRASANRVQGNFIGTDVTGTARLGNSGDGVFILGGSNNLIGGTEPGAGNVIADNADGVDVASGTGNLIQGNLIGTDLTGTVLLGNRGNDGVVLSSGFNTVGGAEAGAGNVIVGSREAGVVLAGNSNRVQGNRIGTDVTGIVALGNPFGLIITGSNNTVGGTEVGAGNIISGNTTTGVSISPPGTGNRVQGNFIGTDITGTQALGNGGAGVTILNSTGNVIGGTEPGAGNLISGNRQDGIRITGPSGRLNQVQGNLIGTDASGTQELGNGGSGVSLNGANDNFIGGTAAGAGNVLSANNIGVLINAGTGNQVLGNWIGTDASGTAPLGNSFGLFLEAEANGNFIAGNLISANRNWGLEIFMGASGNVVRGNWIGTDATGAQALGNDLGGIQISSNSNNNIIGGTEPGAGNLISSNGGDGVEVFFSTGTQIEGNLIGTDWTGTQSLGNRHGVSVLATDTTVGGTAAGAGNLISGNRELGVYLSAVNNVTIAGNIIGADATGTQTLGNGGAGIYLLDGANVTIGGTEPGAGNLISANGGDGITIQGPNTAGILVLGNRIGTDASGEQALGNGGNGVTVTGGAHDNVIGGTEPGAGNVIAFNGGDGVRIDAAVRNAVLHNSIFANAGLGIGLLNGGNDDQPAPVLTSATSGGGLTAIQGTFAGTPDTTFRFEIFVNTTCDPSGSGEGERFLLSLTVATDADGTASFAIELALEVPAGQFLTATATSPTGNTSAFSGCVEVTAPYHRRRPATARRGARRRPPTPPAVAEQAQGTQAQQRDGGGLRHDGSRVQELPAAVIVVR